MAGVAVALCVLAVALVAGPTTAHPPERSDHGLDPATFHALWSGDVDDGRDEPPRGTTGSVEAVRELAAVTDLPFDAPPVAVERWNRGDHGSFPAEGRSRSVHPPGAARSDGAYVRDAYAAVFAVQPSTRALVSRRDRPLYVAPRGVVLGTVDYRVHVPRAWSGPNRTVDWRLRDHGIIETRLRVDGDVVSTGAGTHTPRLRYALESGDDGRVRLTLEADVSVTLDRRVRTCGVHDNESDCIGWNVTRSRRSETLTVRESVAVVPYDLDVSGARARYPGGDRGLVLYKDRPWLGYTVPGGDVHGVWRFYVARDARWDELVTRSAEGVSRAHSPLHPLQVHAFPIEPGPTASPGDRVTILETYGLLTVPPSLPGTVALDVIDVPYTQSLGIATRIEGGSTGDWDVRAAGLVRGESVDVTRVDLREIPVHESELELEVVERGPDTVTVRVTLRDAETGAPIHTLAREGHVVVDGRRLETDATGTAVRTVPRPAGALAARYEPGPWWLVDVGYVGDSTAVYVGGTVLDALGLLYELGVPVALFLAGVFVLDRATGWGVWPPWRRP